VRTAFIRPSGNAVIMLATFVFGGVGLIYAPAQVTDANSSQAEWGDLVALFGVLMVSVAVVGFAAAHVRYPTWLKRLAKIRLKYADKSDQNQWLLDIAAADAGHPESQVIILRKYIDNNDFSPDIERPWIQFGVEFYNASVHSVLIGHAFGRAKYKGNDLGEEVEKGDGKSRVARGTTVVHKIKQYLSKDVAQYIYRELASSGKLTTVSLSGVKVEVTCENGEMPERSLWKGLGNHDLYRRENE